MGATPDWPAPGTAGDTAEAVAASEDMAAAVDMAAAIWTEGEQYKQNGDVDTVCTRMFDTYSYFGRYLPKEMKETAWNAAGDSSLYIHYWNITTCRLWVDDVGLFD